MKANGKEKTPIVATATVVSTEDPSLEASCKQQTDQAKDSSVASAADSEGSVDDSKDSATTQPTADQDGDEDMKEASPITTDVIEEDTPMADPAPIVKPRELPSGIPEGIDQEDLDGGLLDGALDDYDDLDQDTEDTEVGNGDDDFSDDDDDDDDLDGPLLDSTDKTNHYSDAQTPGATSHADTAKSEEPDSDDEMDQDERDEALQSEDSDSDLGDLDASDNDQDDDDDDDDEGDADGEDADDDDDEEEEEIKPPVKKDTVLSQKPTLHRPSITEEELKDSGDELSDLSEFDDTDDSDEDDDIPEPKPAVKEAPVSAPPASPTAATAPTGSTAASTTGPAAPTTTLKPTLGGRKRSLHEATVEPMKPEDESIKSEQEDQVEIPIPSGRARLSEPGSRKRRVSEVEDTQPSDKESESEVAEEEEEAEKTTKEEDEEGEEDHEMKQLHKDALDALTSIEIEFASLRDKYVSGTNGTLMYEERMTELDREVEMINDGKSLLYAIRVSGTHPELSSLMQEIEQKREHRLHIADMGRKHKTEIAQNAHDSARRNTRTQMVNDMGKKRRQINLEFNLSFDARKRKLTTATPDKAVLLRARKHKRAEVNELKSISEKRGFPTSGKLSTVTQAELQDDFALMGLARLLPQPKPAGVDPQLQHHHQHQHHQQHHQQRHGGPLPPSIPISAGASSSSSDVEIYVDGSRCMVDGIWYKPNDAVVVLDASIGKYNAKYVALESDWIVLQRTNGSKTRLHLSLFRGRKLCMQPKV
ncbi:Transcriptional regulatory protein [Linnemannia hyalina]|uniref:Transcriptional regulatory protein n=1 Tax=Linnemannia hyalina TaxID=64524 RepID=A0A9P7XTS2_9FUNG|nr:Transcriptional regulatory protein [Linnemannia hyalina]